LTTIDRIGTVQSGLMAICLGASAVALVRTRPPGWGWLAAGFALRAALGVVESIAYGTHVEAAWSFQNKVGLFLAAHSSLDTGAEWVIALGCVLMLYRNIQIDLEAANGGLIAAQDRLQELLDHDPLTGLKNRRALAGVLRAAYDTGATIVFFDLNDFKEINDTLGHQAGDECLKRFGDALKASFRPGDHVFRFAGDEFVVIAQGAEQAQVVERLDVVRERLKHERVRGHQIVFSAGHAYLAVHGDGEAAMKAADEAMYREKDLKPGGRARR
jgi:diguanylate cyclase (GGDEF)-like protein